MSARAASRAVALAAPIGLALVIVALPARAEPPVKPAAPAAEDEAGLGEDPMPPPGYVPGHQTRIGLGLSPHAPGQVSILPSGIAPAFGAPLRPVEGYKLEFHGHVQAGGRASFNSRQASPEHSSLAIHGDPIVPRGNVFENPNAVPYTWAELRFNYSTPTVTATVALGAWAQSESMLASGTFMPNAQLWVNDAFLSYTPKLGPVQLNLKVGAFKDEYGWMEQYSTGAYGAPLIGSIFGVGETLQARLPLGSDFSLQLEHGIKSDLGRAPPDISQRADNNWSKPWEGHTVVNHGHLGLDYRNMINPAVHYITAFARDDQGDNVTMSNMRGGYQSYTGGAPTSIEALDHGDGWLTIMAADVRFSLQRFGHLYVGVSKSSIEHVRTLNNVVQVLNSGGGRDLMDRYFGRDNDEGRGSLLLAGGEYQVSLGELLRYPDEYWGEGPDLKLSVYGMYGHITSDDPARDGEDKYKIGAEGTYTFLPWLAFAGRIDHAVPYMHAPKWHSYRGATPNGGSYDPRPGSYDKYLNGEPSNPLCEFRPTTYRCFLYKDQNDNTFSVLTGKLIFRSDWTAREALTVQYSRYFYRSNFHLITLNSGGQVSNQTDHPDQDLFAIYGTLWW